MAICFNCATHEGAIRWGESATMAARGYYSFICPHCALTLQIQHAEERAAALPGLREQLASAACAPADAPAASPSAPSESAAPRRPE